MSNVDATGPVLMLLALLYSVPVCADPISNVSEWSQHFTAATLKDEKDEMVSLIDEAKDPRLGIPQIKQGIIDFNRVVQEDHGVYAEQIDDRKLGNMYERITTAVMYSKQPLFYSTTFLREKDGWQIVFFNMNTDVNKAVNLEWPH